MKKIIVFFSVLICLLFSGCENRETLPESVDSITDEIENGESLPENINSIMDKIENGESLPENIDPIIEYDNVPTLRVEDGDSYTETDMALNTADNNVSFKASAFDGRKTLGVLVTGKSFKSTLTIALSIESGTAKIVTVVGDSVTTITECGNETKSISGTFEIALEPDQNYYVIQLVGDNCCDIELTMGISNDA